MATISAEFLADVSSREKEKAKEAKGNDLVLGQGLRRKARAISQTIKSQAFYGKKGKKGGKKGGKKQKDSFKSSKKGKNSKGDSSSSSGKANMANSSPSEEHVDATEATAAGQDAWSEDYYKACSC